MDRSVVVFVNADVVVTALSLSLTDKIKSRSVLVFVISDVVLATFSLTSLATERSGSLLGG